MDLNDRRVRAITALLRTRYDYLPAPRGCLSGALTTKSVSKTTATEEVPCPTCSGRGRFAKSKCERCKGSGRILVDPYTGEDDLSKGADTGTIGSGESRSRAHKRLVAALRRMERDEEHIDEESDPVLATLLRREAAGSYRELDLALEQLRFESELEWRLVLSVHADDSLLEVEALNSWQEMCFLGAMMRLSELMPPCLERCRCLKSCREIRVPKDVEDWDEARRDISKRNGKGRWPHGTQQVVRNAEIVTLNHAGWSVGELALRFGLSKRQVRNVLASKKVA